MGNKTLTGMAVKMMAVVGVGVGATLFARRKRAGAQPQSTDAQASVPVSPAAPNRIFSQDDIALRAYFISERRRTAGAPADPHQDWIEAERELQEEKLNRPAEPENR